MKNNRRKRLLSAVTAAALSACTVPVCALQSTEEVSAEEVNRYTVLVLDTSNESRFLQNGKVIFTADTALSYVKTAASRFMEYAEKADGNNQIAVVSYRKSTTLVSDFTDDYNTLNNKINAITASDDERDIASGLKKADELLAAVSDEGAVKNVVLFTTGMTNCGSSSASGHYDMSVTGSNWVNLRTSINLYKYANVAYNAAESLKSKNATIYSIGLFQTYDGMPDVGKPIAKFFELTAKDLASEGCFYPTDDPEKLAFTFGKVADAIVNTRVKDTFSFPSGKKKNDTDRLYDYQQTFFYDDAYFNKSSTEYDPSLATMSLCFVLSAFGSNETSSYADKSRNAKELLTKIQCDPDTIETNEYFTKKPSEDSMGVIAGMKEISVNGEPCTLICVSTRGGGYEAEWAGNLTVGAFGRHEGFQTAAQITESFLNTYVSKHKNKIKGDVKLWINGFSRGAITANLVAADITKAGRISDVPITKENIFAYCFEPPQGENVENLITRKEAASYNNIHNIVNHIDLVPKVAMKDWGFMRYGVDENVIPTRLTTSNSEAYTKMMKQFCAMETPFTNASLAEVDADKAYYTYNGKHYRHVADTFQAKKVDIGLLGEDAISGGFKRKSVILPWGDTLEYYVPYVDIDWDPHAGVVNDDRSLEVFLNDLTFEVACGFGNRVSYTQQLQPSMRLIMSEFMGDHYESYKFDKASEAFEKKVDDNLATIIATYVASNIAGVETLLTEYYIESLAEQGIDFYAYANTVNPETLKEALESVARLILASALTNGLDDVATLCGEGNADIITQFYTHFPELCLAWLQSQDEHYTPDGERLFVVDSYRVVHINCPVDVDVYNSEGKLVAQIKNDQPQDIPDSMISAVYSSDGEKLVYLPADADYTIEIKATDTGTLNYSVAEYSYDSYQYEKIVNYNDIPITAGDSLKGEAPAFEGEDAAYTGDGSNVSYTLSKNGSVLAASNEFKGTDAENAVYMVRVNSDNGRNSQVSGGGVFTEGAFAKVRAYSLEGSDFKGWYVGDTLVSADADYRFRVSENTELTAKFEGEGIKAKAYEAEVIFKDCEHGRIVNAENGVYEADTVLNVSAVPDSGYVFSHWETSGENTFTDYLAANTSFSVPKDAVYVQAIFAKDDGTATKPSESAGVKTPDVNTPSVVDHINRANPDSLNPSPSPAPTAPAAPAATAAAAPKNAASASSPETTDRSLGGILVTALGMLGIAILSRKKKD